MNKHETLVKMKERELMFSANGYNGSGGLTNRVRIKIGKAPVLLSVPHSTNHLRENKLKYADKYTGSIGLILQELTDCSIIYTTCYHSGDPNFDIQDLYKERLGNILETNTFRCVIDIHGASRSHPFTIDLGTRHGESIDRITILMITKVFSKNGIHGVTENNTFTAEGKGTITTFCSKLKRVPAIQMEINGDYRDPESHPNQCIALIQSLKEIIENLSHRDIYHES